MNAVDGSDHYERAIEGERYPRQESSDLMEM